MVFYNDERGEFDDAIGVEFVDEKELRKPRRKLLKPPPLRRLITPRKVGSTTDNKPQTVGISTLIGRLDLLPVSYQLRLIRFAEAKDAIKAVDGTVVTRGFVSESQIGTLMEAPFGGDEHLIDAIVEGLPQIDLRSNAIPFLLVLTDEPSTGHRSTERAIEICQSLGMRAYVIGYPADDFQSTLAEQTGGRLFTMPNHLSKAYPNQLCVMREA